MTWSSMINVEAGQEVSTEHGHGTVRAVSPTQNSARVDVGGQLFEVPLNEISLPPSGQTSEGSEELLKPGFRVEHKSTGDRGEVSEVTQRTVRVKYDSGKELGYPKKNVWQHIKRASKSPEGTAPDNYIPQIGDDVRVIDNGQAYTSFTAKAEELGATNFTKEELVDNGTMCEVVNYHRASNIALIQATGGKQYLVGARGLEKIDKKPEQKPEQKPEVQEGEVVSTADSLYGLMHLQRHLEQKIDQNVEGQLKELKEAVESTKKLEIKVGDKTTELEGLKHKQLEQLITYSALRLNPLLVGMAGTGKTHAGEQVAEALGLNFYAMSVGAQTSKSDITGYKDANGGNVRTHFREAYEHGGVFLMDEIDAGNSNVLIQINSALSNGLMAFPDAMVPKHEDFVFIASANTYGNGANRQYVGRNQLDAATLDRFAVIDWLIDDQLEEKLAVGAYGKAWYTAVKATRDYVSEHNIRALVSPRATQKGSKLIATGQPLSEVISATLLGSVPEDKKQDVKDVATRVFESQASDVPSNVEVNLADILK